jgi:hypothetical protein
MDTNLITEAIELIGIHVLAAACGVSYQAVRKWEAAGRLPRTDWTGDTNYSEIIERLSKGRITQKALLRRKAA